MRRFVAIGFAWAFWTGCAARPTELVVGETGGARPDTGSIQRTANASTPSSATPEAPPRDAWVDVAFDGQAEFVAFRTADALLVASAQVGDARGVVELEGDQRRTIAAAPAGPPAAYSAASGSLAFTSGDGIIVRTLDGSREDVKIATPRPGSLAFSNTGDRLALTTAQPLERARAMVLDPTTGKQLRRMQPFGRRVLPYDSGFLLVARFFADDRIAFLLANDTPVEAHVAVWSSAGRKQFVVCAGAGAMRDRK